VAAITVIAPVTTSGNWQLLESVAVVNAAATTTVQKAVALPAWGPKYATFVLDITAMTGTTPLLDFTLLGVDVSGTNPPDDAKTWPLGSWNGVTQNTTSGTVKTTGIDVGPTITVDDTGSATADDHYGVNCILPPWIVYQYIYDGTTLDEDYTFTVAVYWSK